MVTSAPPRKKRLNIDALRDDWAQSTQSLAEQVASWAQQEPGWRVDPFTETDITEEPLGTYSARVVTIHTPSDRLVLEPIARNYPGTGIVELYAWPTLFRVRLMRGDLNENWKIRVDSGFFLHQEWSRENFIQLANDLLGAA